MNQGGTTCPLQIGVMAGKCYLTLKRLEAEHRVDNILTLSMDQSKKENSNGVQQLQ